MWFSFRCGHQETPMQLFTFVYPIFRSENSFRFLMVLSKLNMSAMSSNKELKEPPILARTHWYREEISLENLLKPVLTAFLYWSQVVPSVVLPYREPLSDHDSWRYFKYFDILYFWHRTSKVKLMGCKTVWLIDHLGTESRVVSRNGHLLQLLAAEHAEDRDIRRFHCTTDFFTEVEYWIQQSSLLAITWTLTWCYGTVILKKTQWFGC